METQSPANPAPKAPVAVPHGTLWSLGLKIAEAEISLGLETGDRWFRRAQTRRELAFSSP